MQGQDLALELVFQTALYADYRQTRRIAENPTIWFETNPLLGVCPTVPHVRNYMLIAGAAHWAISELLPQGPYRTAWQGVSLAVEMGTIQSNVRLGLHF
jgi:hypothetical protein